MKTRVLLLDIEGTVCPVDFVKLTLFPYARVRLAEWVRANADDALVRELGPALERAIQTLERWSDEDQKITTLKTIQGRIWKQGYLNGSIVAPLYEDVAPALRAWAKAGCRIAIYSSGSIDAQRLLFGHSSAGDLTPLISAYFDTTTGPKREASSYAAIARVSSLEPAEVLFCSDSPEEVQAAAGAGCQAWLIRRGSSNQLEARLPLPA